jgi:hypothetical protein
LRRFRESQLAPDAVVPAWVEREFGFALGGDRIRGRFDRVDIVPIAADSATITGGARVVADAPSILRADVVEPMLELLGPEEVTITDYKTSDVRDPAIASQRARDSLQLQIYAMAYESVGPRSIRRGSKRPAAGSRRLPRGFALATTRPARTRWRARTARSGTSARRARRAE